MSNDLKMTDDLEYGVKSPLTEQYCCKCCPINDITKCAECSNQKNKKHRSCCFSQKW